MYVNLTRDIPGKLQVSQESWDSPKYPRIQWDHLYQINEIIYTCTNVTLSRGILG